MLFWPVSDGSLCICGWVGEGERRGEEMMEKEKRHGVGSYSVFARVIRYG
jgi:hypothetical protein